MRDYCDEGTPVPIPNTVVKLVYGDNTWLATAREDNTSRTQRQQLRLLSFFVHENHLPVLGGGFFVALQKRSVI